MSTGREKRYRSLLKRLIMAANRENKRENHKDPPTKDLYGGIELI